MVLSDASTRNWWIDSSGYLIIVHVYYKNLARLSAFPWEMADSDLGIWLQTLPPLNRFLSWNVSLLPLEGPLPLQLWLYTDTSISVLLLVSNSHTELLWKLTVCSRSRRLQQTRNANQNSLWKEKLVWVVLLLVAAHRRIIKIQSSKSQVRTVI